MTPLIMQAHGGVGLDFVRRGAGVIYVLSFNHITTARRRERIEVNRDAATSVEPDLLQKTMCLQLPLPAILSLISRCRRRSRIVLNKRTWQADDILECDVGCCSQSGAIGSVCHRTRLDMQLSQCESSVAR